ncbi:MULTISPECIES: copper chaperone PCu(A)C [unclassified Streptomyces]|uniref:copper chaperone PCu(A)C n=1 Tax=unclassified Streptomyces TaxID=2593676 RepID=UPI0022543A15|nr:MULTISPECIES: copper chaperone PCu(A)C [unclassified Streptomyces]MCX5146779.1 copper chaperone PCu(A)C [Streptomyces sp. NBC_00320]WSN49955.1 copper chaperone PCu(A)C [Streptomyces sp. NBC_01296]WSW60629.1 copper chaperone PCu(A)C [Streptomyces sp. NBC_00998]
MNARTTRTLAAALSLTAALAISGCSSDSDSGSAAKAGADKPKMTVTGAFMPEPVNDKMAGAFMVIKNDSKTADKLTAVTSPLSDDLQIHETKDQKMQQVAAMDVPANGELKLERGGSHVMFMGLKNTPKVGDKVTVELRFEKADPVKVELDVKERTYNAQNTSAH